MAPLNFCSKPKSHKRFFTLVASVFSSIIVVGIALYFIQREPVQSAIENNFRKTFQIESAKIEKREFSFRDFAWHWELVAPLKSASQSPFEVKNLNIKARKTLWGRLVVDKAILQIQDSAGRVKGGVVFGETKNGWELDLTNLELNMGSFKKPMGTPAQLVLTPTGDDSFDGKLDFNRVKLDIKLKRHTNSDWILQIPSQKISTRNQSIPFGMFADLESTGEWEISSRVEINGGIATDATTIKAKDMLINVSSFKGDFFQNHRGVAVLNLDLQASELGVDGSVKIDLTKAALELNDHKFFKSDGERFIVDGTFERSLLSGEIELGESHIDFDMSEGKELTASFTKLPLELLPRIKGIGSLKHGTLNGKFSAHVTEDPLGTHSFSAWKLSASDFEAEWDQLELFGFAKISAPAQFNGTLELASQNDQLKDIAVAGVFDLRQSDFNLLGEYQKEAGVPFFLKLKTRRKDGKLVRLEGSGESGPNFFKYQLKKEGVLAVTFPQAFKAINGSLSGSVDISICGLKFSDSCVPQVSNYDLTLADWAHRTETGAIVKLSGHASSLGNEKIYKNLRASLNDTDWLKISATFKGKETPQIDLEGFAEMHNAKLVDPGSILKTLKLETADVTLNLQVKDDDREWQFRSKGKFADKKLRLDEWTLASPGLKFEGQAEFSFEDYFLRNEKISFTSTAKTEGRLENMSKLSSAGNFSGDVTIASTGANLSEWIDALKARFIGNVKIDESPVTKLLGEVFKSYADENKGPYSKGLLACLPQKITGKFDAEYSNGNWNLAPSLFRGADKDSMLKFQGALMDFKNVNLTANYLPGPQCNAFLSTCLGDVFPKGGIALELSGTFKDPETDLDFKLMNEALEKCAKQDEVRAIATVPKINPREQRARVRELKNFYKSRVNSR